MGMELHISDALRVAVSILEMAALLLAQPAVLLRPYYG
jgi:hypothetical protein